MKFLICISLDDKCIFEVVLPYEPRVVKKNFMEFLKNTELS